MLSIMEYALITICLFGVSFACSITRTGMSTQTFLTAMTIGIGVMIWRDIFPFYMVIVCGAIIIGMLFNGGSEHE